MSYRVWLHEEFMDCNNDDERDDRAWKVPDEVSFFDPSHKTPCDDVQDAAEKYADYFHSNRDGWDSTWPIDFVVHDGDKFYLVNVDREAVPTFNAARPKEITV